MKQWMLMAGLIFALIVPVKAQPIAADVPSAVQIFAPGVEVLSETIVPVPTAMPASDSFPIFQQPTLAVDDLPPAPDGYEWGLPSGDPGLPPTESPNGRWQVAFAYLTEANNKPVHVLSYDRASGAYRDLGTIETGDYYEWGEWYDEHIVLLLITRMALHSSSKSLYVLDTGGEGLVIGPIDSPSELMDYDPPELKVFWIEGEFEKPSTCRLSTYDVVSKQETERPYGPYCFLEFQSKAGANYYRAVTPNRKQATVARFDAETGEHVDLYSGEVERIFWVSADERYAALALDTSGVVDLLPGAGAFSSRYTQTELTIVDLTTGQALYNDTPMTFDNTIGVWSASVFEVREGWLWVVSDRDPALGPNRLIHVADGQAEADLLDAHLSTEVGGGWFIITPPGRWDYRWVKLYNIDTKQTAAVGDVTAFPEYTMGINRLEDSTFEVIVQCCSISPDAFQYEYEAHYTVRVQGVEW